MPVEIISRLTAVRGGVRRGHLTGTTTTTGSPDIPVSRVVQLVERDRAAPVFMSPAGPLAQVMSGADGAWRFDGLYDNAVYAVIAYDHTEQYDPVIKINLVPTVT